MTDTTTPHGGAPTLDAMAPLPASILEALKALRSAAYKQGVNTAASGDGPDSASAFRAAERIIATALSRLSGPAADAAVLVDGWRPMSEEPINRPITARMRLGDGSWWYARVKVWRHEDGDGGRFGDHGYELLHYNGDVTMGRFYGPFDGWCEIDAALSTRQTAAGGDPTPAVGGVVLPGGPVCGDAGPSPHPHRSGLERALEIIGRGRRVGDDIGYPGWQRYSHGEIRDLLEQEIARLADPQARPAAPEGVDGRQVTAAMVDAATMAFDLPDLDLAPDETGIVDLTPAIRAAMPTALRAALDASGAAPAGEPLPEGVRYHDDDDYLSVAQRAQRVVAWIDGETGDLSLTDVMALRSAAVWTAAQGGAAIHAHLADHQARPTAPEGFHLPDIEAVSDSVHEAWMASKRKQGITSRKSEAGDELMVPYADLSEAAKDLDRGTVRAVFDAIRALASSALAGDVEARSTPLPTASADEVRAEAEFLWNRLQDLDSGTFTEEGARDFHGHVAPSMARLRAALDAGGGGAAAGDGVALDARRYRWLRSRDVDTIHQGGVFAGQTPENLVLSEEHLDAAIDAAMAARALQPDGARS